MYDEINEMNIELERPDFSFFDNLMSRYDLACDIDEGEEPAAEKGAKYLIFDSDVFPFCLFGEELNNINHYCYETYSKLLKDADFIENNFNKYKKMSEREIKEYFTDIDGFDFSKYELLMGCDSSTSDLKSIVRFTTDNLVMLLYSFLERTLKKIKNELFVMCEKAANESKKSKVKIYACLEQIFGMSIEDFSSLEPEIFSDLEMVRRYRNKSVHGNNDDMVYDEYEREKELPPFKLVDLIELISVVLYKVEKVYRSHL